jgi:Rad3-related DNA helicase
MWSLHDNEKELKPLVFSNGKSQADIIKEVDEAVKQGYKLIFIKGVCGTGKSAIALNLARHFGRASIVVPIKSLQEQYTEDYTKNKYVLRANSKLKICSIVGRKNFKCKFLEEETMPVYLKEKNSTLYEIFEESEKSKKESDNSCDNAFIPCKIEIKERNISRIKDFIKKNPLVKFSDFKEIGDVKRMSIGPACKYWAPILPEELELRQFKDSKKIKYCGLENRGFAVHQSSQCPYYDQYKAYAEADVLIFNSSKYKIETLMNRKPATDIEIIDECDEFLDSFSEEQQISLNRLTYSAGYLFSSNTSEKKLLEDLQDIIRNIKSAYDQKYILSSSIFELVNSKVGDLLNFFLKNTNLIDLSEEEESNYLFHVYEVAKVLEDSFKETYFSIEPKDKDLIIKLVSTNLSKGFNDMLNKNKIMVLMSGTVHSEHVLKNIFGFKNFKIIEAETQNQGELINAKQGYEIDCKYSNFQSGKITREQYLKTLNKCVQIAKRPVLIHVNSFNDLPTEREKSELTLEFLQTQENLIETQKNDPLGKRIRDFKNKKIDTLFTTKCNRGIDFPGEICNSVVITRYPYPNISSVFWRILKKTNPAGFMDFYMDKANRELLQKVYRALRSKRDKVLLLSPDIRVLNFFDKK